MAESEAGPGPREPSSSSSGEPYQRRWQALALLGLAQLMLILDITVVTVALPEMGDDLGLDREALTWVVSAYTLAFGGLMLLGGRAADTFGPTRILLSGLGVFTIASLVAGLATGGEVLIAARAVQGVGAALLSPAALPVLVRIFTGAELNRALGIWSALGGVGVRLRSKICAAVRSRAISSILHALDRAGRAEIGDRSMPTALTGTASIAADTVSPPAAAASDSRDSLASSGAKVGVGIDADFGGELALLIGHAEQPGDRIARASCRCWRGPTVMRPNIVPMPLNVSPTVFFGIGDQAPVYLNGLKPASTSALP